MKTIGPQTEAGPAVVPQRPTTEAERLEWLVRLAIGAAIGQKSYGGLVADMTSSLAPAAKAWTADVDELAASCREVERITGERDEARKELVEADFALAGARGRIAQLEEALAAAGREVTDRKRAAALAADHSDAMREAHADAVQRHAVEMGEMRSALLHLSMQLAREIRRGGGA